MIPRTFEYLVTETQKVKDTDQGRFPYYRMKAYFIEIYNEQVSKDSDIKLLSFIQWRSPDLFREGTILEVHKVQLKLKKLFNSKKTQSFSFDFHD